MFTIVIALFLFGCLCAFLGFLFGELYYEPVIKTPENFEVHQGDDGFYYVYPKPEVLH